MLPDYAGDDEEVRREKEQARTEKCTCDLPVYGQYKGFLKLGIKSTCLYCASTIETGVLYGGYEAETDRFFLLIHIIVHPSIFLLVCHTQLKSREHQQRPVLFLHPYQHTVCLQRLLWRHFQIERCWARLHAPAPVMWPTHFIRLHQGMSCRLSQRCRRAHVCI